jgi:hypothetical protein
MLVIFKEPYLGIETGGLHVEKGQRVDIPDKYFDALIEKGLIGLYVTSIHNVIKVEDETPKKRGRRSASS